MVLTIIFWVLLVVLMLFGGVGIADPSPRPWVGKASGVVLLVLLAILGYFVFGNPVHR